MTRPVSALVGLTLAQAGCLPDQIRNWWKTPNRGLGGLCPLDAVRSEGERVLQQAERDAAGIGGRRG